MDHPILLHFDDRVAVVTISNPPVNALSAGLPEGIRSALGGAAVDLAALMVIGAGCTFIAGAVTAGV
jgi:3-hydroxyacyl-CoA dehydrogenase